MPAAGKVVAAGKARERDGTPAHGKPLARAASWLAAVVLVAPAIASAVQASNLVSTESTNAAAMTTRCVDAPQPPRRPTGHPPARPTAAPVQVEVTCNAAASQTALSSAEAASSVNPAAPAAREPASEHVPTPCAPCDAVGAPERFDETHRSLHANLVYALEAAMTLLVAAAVALVGWVILQARDEDIAITSYWGGFGASGTGWEMTRPAVALLGAGLLLGLAAVLATVVLQSTAPTVAASAALPSLSAAATGRGVASPDPVASATRKP